MSEKPFYTVISVTDYTPPDQETQDWLDELSRAYNAGEPFQWYGTIIDIPRIKKISGTIGEQEMSDANKILSLIAAADPADNATIIVDGRPFVYGGDDIYSAGDYPLQEEIPKHTKDREMTLHKIDREKLAEALEIICARPDNAQEAQNVADDFYEFEMKNDVTPYDFIEQAAQNWLTITDPGFEPSKNMRARAFPWLTAWSLMNETTKMDALSQAFKSMIAKAGE